MLSKILSKYFLYPLFLIKENNLGMLIKLREVQRNYTKSTQYIDGLRLKKLRKLINHANKNCPYYNELFKKNSIDIENFDFSTLKDFPILTKDNIRSNIDHIMSANFKSHLLKDSTGGSTGEPMVFYRDKNCLDLRNGYQLYLNQLLGIDIGTSYALIWGASMDLGNNIGLKAYIRDKYIFKRLILNANRMNLNTMEVFTRQLIKRKPKVIYGYPSAINEYCNYLERSKNRIDFVKSVICTAEPINEDQRDNISQILNCRIYNRYTSRECGILAQECGYGNGMHINYLSIEMQIRGNSILITDLENFGMPLINYAIGDSVTDEKISYELCRCGFPGPIMNLNASRETDFFVLSDGTLIFGAGIPIMSLTGEKGIKQIQIIQKELYLFIVNIVKDSNFAESNIKRIEDVLKRYMGNNIEIQFNYLNKIKRTISSGKYRYIISEVGRNMNSELTGN